MRAAQYLEAFVACALKPEVTGADSLDAAMERVVDDVRHVSVVYLIGNGGSASVVSHAQNDLVKAARIRATVFQDVPLLTACANDLGYQASVSEPLSLWIDKTDMLIAVSSSGASANVLAAVQIAKKYGARVVTLSGFLPNNPLRKLGDVNFYVPSTNYGHVELTHAALLHCLTDRLAESL